MIRSALLVAAAALATFAVSARAEPASVEEIMEVLRENGAEDLERDDSSEEFTQIYGSLRVDAEEPVMFTTRVMRCNMLDKCSTVLMFANFDMGRPLAQDDYVTVNAYNDSYPFGRTYLYNNEDTNEVTIGIDYVVDLEDENTFGSNEINTFRIILNSFFEHMIESGGD